MRTWDSPLSALSIGTDEGRKGRTNSKLDSRLLGPGMHDRSRVLAIWLGWAFKRACDLQVGIGESREGYPGGEGSGHELSLGSRSLLDEHRDDPLLHRK